MTNQKKLEQDPEQEKTLTKLKLIVALDEILRSPKSPYEKDLYKGKMPQDLEKKVEELREKIRQAKAAGKNYRTNEKEKKTVEKFLLTHYLTYICNRQDSPERVFDEGGYVISRMVVDFFNERPTPDSFDDWFRRWFDENELCLRAKESNKNATFTAHYMAQEAASMYRFLRFLTEKPNGFLEIFDVKGKGSLDTVFKCLDQNTYRIGQKTKKDLERFISGSGTKFRKGKKKYTSEQHRYDRKRLWCCLRDYLYNTDFSELLAAGISQEAFKKLNNGRRYLELPGDVYNNNPKLAECIWNKIDYKSSDGKFNSPRFVREQYDRCYKYYKQQLDQPDEGPDIGWVPINYDVSFLYVQNMCRRSLCTACPMIGNGFLNDEYRKLLESSPSQECSEKQKSGWQATSEEKYKKEFKKHWEKMCHKRDGLYCLYVLMALGIFYECRGETECSICGLVKKLIDQ